MPNNTKPRNDEALREQGNEGKQNKLDSNDTSANNQCAIVMETFRTRRKLTAELWHDFAIMSPPQRVKDLRNAGYLIDTIRVNATTTDGITHHNAALYVLRAEVVHHG